MRLAVEDKYNNIAFFKIDGRQKKLFIEKAKKDIEGLKEIWSYDYLDEYNKGQYINVKVLWSNKNKINKNYE